MAVAVLVLGVPVAAVPAVAVAAVFGKPSPIRVPIVVFIGLCLYAMPKANWVEQYDCVCGARLNSVTTDSFQTHLSGKRHKDPLSEAPQSQDFA